jgi:hypothetical protein
MKHYADTGVPKYNTHSNWTTTDLPIILACIRFSQHRDDECFANFFSMELKAYIPKGAFF